MRLYLKYFFGACVMVCLLIFIKFNTDLLESNSKLINLDIFTALSEYANAVSRNTTSAVEPAPHPHTNLHPANLTVINITDFQIEINQDICNISNIAMVITILSAVQNKEARDVIRRTWGNPGIPGVNTRLVFLLGRTEDMSGQDELKAEAHQFGDIVQGGFLDSYRNLSYKSIFGKLWVSQFCEQAEFVLKTDDDMYIDLFATYHITRQYLTSQKYQQNEFLLCPVNGKVAIFRNPDNKWFVSYEDIPKEEKAFPPYCSGSLHITNPGTAKRLTEVATTTKFFWIEDAWITGYLVKALNFTHIDLFEFMELESVKKALLLKIVQNPDIYHKDVIAGFNQNSFEISLTMHRHAEWCYIHKCYNNIYSSKENITKEHTMMNEVLIKHL